MPGNCTQRGTFEHYEIFGFHAHEQELAVCLRFDQDQVSSAPAILSKLRTRTSISGRRFPGPYRFSNRPVYPRADETGYRLIGVVVTFRRIIGDPTLNAKPGIRTAVEKSAHNKLPNRAGV